MIYEPQITINPLSSIGQPSQLSKETDASEAGVAARRTPGQTNSMKDCDAAMAKAT
jgi:hypothetical protein